MIARRQEAAAAGGKPARKRKSAVERAKSRDRIGNVVVACLGVAVGLGAAAFPWYVFFNQDEFGIKAMRFSGEGIVPDQPLTYQPQRIPRPVDIAEAPVPDLDFFPTATLPDREKPVRAVGVDEQPFPEEVTPVPFRLVHVANGRAMIEDAEGLWLVRPGSVLPDSTRVAAIEQRDAAWVIVTSDQRVIPLEQ